MLRSVNLFSYIKIKVYLCIEFKTRAMNNIDTFLAERGEDVTDITFDMPMQSISMLIGNMPIIASSNQLDNLISGWERLTKKR